MMKIINLFTELFHSLHDIHSDYIVLTIELVRVYDNQSILNEWIRKDFNQLIDLPFTWTWISCETVPRELVAIHS
jgi:hypothetical protein